MPCKRTCGDASEREHARRPCWRFQQDGWKLLQAAGKWCGADGDVESAHGPLDQKQGRGDDTVAELKKLTTQFAEHTLTVRGRTVKTCARCRARRCNSSQTMSPMPPQELISNFQTLVEDYAQKFIVSQLKTVEAAIDFRADGYHGQAAHAKVDLVWIS